MELVVTLAVLAAALALATPRLAELGDRVAVRAVREQLVGLVAQTRAAGVARGGAALVLESEPPVARLVAGDSVLRVARLGSDDRSPELLLPSSRSSVTLPFDALGLGRFASGTIVVRQGTAEAAIVVSAYGRVRRR
jgi:Tfp pilus assembly protein FimT